MGKSRPERRKPNSAWRQPGRQGGTVMGTGVATDRIKSGTMLVVDGDAGTVTLEEPA